MDRRSVLASLCGVVVAPSVSLAQSSPMPLIGLLDSASSTPAELADFYAGLQLEGYIRNKTLAIDYRSASGDYSRLPALATYLVKSQVTAVTAIGFPAAAAAKMATTTVPIIFAVAPDPVRSGLVDSLDEPGGNLTGVTDLAEAYESKRLQLLQELSPTAGAIAFLVNSLNPNTDAQSRGTLAAGRAMGVQVRLIKTKPDEDLGTTFGALAAMQPRGLVIADDEFFDSQSSYLAVLALHHRLPAIFQGRAFASAGGLISYGSNLTETYHQAGVYTGMILNGAKAAGLPIYQSIRTEFIINASTAAYLRIAISPEMLRAANEVIKLGARF